MGRSLPPHIAEIGGEAPRIRRIEDFEIIGLKAADMSPDIIADYGQSCACCLLVSREQPLAVRDVLLSRRDVGNDPGLDRLITSDMQEQAFTPGRTGTKTLDYSMGTAHPYA